MEDQNNHQIRETGTAFIDELAKFSRGQIDQVKTMTASLSASMMALNADVAAMQSSLSASERERRYPPGYMRYGTIEYRDQTSYALKSVTCRDSKDSADIHVDVPTIVSIALSGRNGLAAGVSRAPSTHYYVYAIREESAPITESYLLLHTASAANGEEAAAELGFPERSHYRQLPLALTTNADSVLYGYVYPTQSSLRINSPKIVMPDVVKVTTDTLVDVSAYVPKICDMVKIRFQSLVQPGDTNNVSVTDVLDNEASTVLRSPLVQHLSSTIDMYVGPDRVMFVRNSHPVGTAQIVLVGYYVKADM